MIDSIETMARILTVGLRNPSHQYPDKYRDENGSTRYIIDEQPVCFVACAFNDLIKSDSSVSASILLKDNLTPDALGLVDIAQALQDSSYSWFKVSNLTLRIFMSNHTYVDLLAVMQRIGK